MKMCADHWSKLRNAIDARGLAGLIPKSGEEAATRLAAGQFDPLISAHNALLSNVLSTCGLAALGDGCPLCLVIDTCACGEGAACVYLTWIDRASDDQLAAARAKGLVGGGAA